ncbi:hypothetical protein [Janthinobacterium sp. CG_23.4]|uniref:hypothetical protein n=1 Tax=Janthinobacterium sp. CG_23.4 TaxID=2760707 RepID=UPI002475A5F9|nr:hypothetical protein [Janthinobacterium sp. CG_23.4]
MPCVRAGHATVSVGRLPPRLEVWRAQVSLQQAGKPLLPKAALPTSGALLCAITVVLPGVCIARLSSHRARQP